jgi:polyisoprenoid-binding protein YceI
MRKYITLFAFANIISISAMAQDAWKMDRSHTNISFSISHMVISEVVGIFNDFTIDFVTSNEDYSDSKINVAIESSSISTQNERRDADLRSDGFFDVSTHPQITFTTTSFEKTGDKTFTITGDLTMKGITKQVVFDAVHNGTITTGRGIATGWKATTTIDRFEFGLNWNRALDTGNLIAGKDVVITVNAEFRK